MQKCVMSLIMAVGLLLAPAASLGDAVTIYPAAGVPILVIDENFEDDEACGSIGACLGTGAMVTHSPQNAGFAGKWEPNGLRPALIADDPDPDNNTNIQVQNGGMMLVDGTTKANNMGSIWARNYDGCENHPELCKSDRFNQGGIIRFQTANGGNVVADQVGDRIRGEFQIEAANSMSLSFGLVSDIAGLQAYQADIEPANLTSPWSGHPQSMPDGRTGSVNFHSHARDDASAQNIGINTSAIQIGISNHLSTHPIVDMDNDGQVDINPTQAACLGKDCKDNPYTAGDPVPGRGLVPWEIRANKMYDNMQRYVFEYVVGDTHWDVLQVEHPFDGHGLIDIVQGPDSTDDPGGPMPVGLILDSFEGMYFSHTTDAGEAWIDAIRVEVIPVPEPAALALLGIGGLLMTSRRRKA